MIRCPWQQQLIPHIYSPSICAVGMRKGRDVWMVWSSVRINVLLALLAFFDDGLQRISVQSASSVKKRWYWRLLERTLIRSLPFCMQLRQSAAATYDSTHTNIMSWPLFISAIHSRTVNLPVFPHAGQHFIDFIRRISHVVLVIEHRSLKISPNALWANEQESKPYTWNEVTCHKSNHSLLDLQD